MTIPCFFYSISDFSLTCYLIMFSNIVVDNLKLCLRSTRGDSRSLILHTLRCAFIFIYETVFHFQGARCLYKKVYEYLATQRYVTRPTYIWYNNGDNRGSTHTYLVILRGNVLFYISVSLSSFFLNRDPFSPIYIVNI